MFYEVGENQSACPLLLVRKWFYDALHQNNIVNGTKSVHMLKFISFFTTDLFCFGTDCSRQHGATYL